MNGNLGIKEFDEFTESWFAFGIFPARVGLVVGEILTVFDGTVFDDEVVATMVVGVAAESEATVVARVTESVVRESRHGPTTVVSNDASAPIGVTSA
jgi:hypothetical protein